MQEAALFTWTLIVEPSSPASVQWNEASLAILNCEIAIWETQTCDPPMEVLQQNLEAVPGNNGYNCTADEILAVGSSMQVNQAETYAANYAVQYVNQGKVGQLHLYTNTSGVFVTVDGVYMKNATWKAGCTPSDVDPACVNSPNKLSWSFEDGNPTSGQLDFRLMMAAAADLPPNSYTGPYFVGSISPTKEVSTDSKYDAVGVLYQNDVVTCGTSAAPKEELLVNFTTWMVAGAPQACLAGPYCIHIVDNATGAATDDPFNFTVGPDYLKLGAADIPEYFLDNSQIVWNASEGQPWAGSVTINKAQSLTQLVGHLWQAGGALQNVTGYSPSSGSSCYKAPVQANGGWWSKAKPYFGLIGEMAIQIICFEVAKKILYKLAAPIEAVIRRLARWTKRQIEAAKKPAVEQEMRPDTLENPQDSPAEVEANQEYTETLDESFAEVQEANAFEAEMAEDADLIAEYDALLADPATPAQLKPSLEADKSQLEAEVQMNQDEAAIQATVRESYQEAETAAVESIEEVEAAEAVEMEEFEAAEEAEFEEIFGEEGGELADEVEEVFEFLPK